MAETTPCAQCGEGFVMHPLGKTRRFCSERCRYRAKRRPERQCPVCLRMYRSVGLVQETCSWGCAIKARHIGEAEPFAVHRCHCGSAYIKRLGRWHCDIPRSERGLRTKPKVSVPCATCARQVITRPGQSVRYCSIECRRRSPNHRANKRRDKDNRAMRKRRAFVEAVERRKVYDRDGWVCQLCRLPVLRDKVAPHPKSATLDHIIPLSAGGLHAYANVQLAHFLCNSRKSDGAAQLRWDTMAGGGVAA